MASSIVIEVRIDGDLVQRSKIEVESLERALQIADLLERRARVAVTFAGETE